MAAFQELVVRKVVDDVVYVKEVDCGKVEHVDFQSKLD